MQTQMYAIASSLVPFGLDAKLCQGICTPLQEFLHPKGLCLSKSVVDRVRGQPLWYGLQALFVGAQFIAYIISCMIHRNTRVRNMLCEYIAKGKEFYRNKYEQAWGIYIYIQPAVCYAMRNINPSTRRNGSHWLDLAQNLLSMCTASSNQRQVFHSSRNGHLRSVGRVYGG